MSTDAGTATAHSFNKILSKPKYPSKSRGSGGETDEDSNIKKLRRLILVEGIPANVDPTLRPKIWKILLRITDVSADNYLQ
ncbi:CDC16 protein [Marasmius tenuissimus]|nr:CDC16 protein [Marasmius tenuissimus]